MTQGFDDHLTHNSFEAEIAEQEPVKVIESNKSFFGLIGCCLMEESVNIPKEVIYFRFVPTLQQNLSFAFSTIFVSEFRDHGCKLLEIAYVWYFLNIVLKYSV